MPTVSRMGPEHVGHGEFNVHMEESLPCAACDLIADIRAILDAAKDTTAP